MNLKVRGKLCEIVAHCGRDVYEDTRRLRALLGDLCSAAKREIHVLVSAAEQRVPADLATSATLAWTAKAKTDKAMKEMNDFFGSGKVTKKD